MIDCNSRDRWAELLWELNQADESGRERSTILIHAEKDLLWLLRAIVGRRIVQLNGDEENLSLTNFNVGTMVQIPDMLADEIHVIAELDRVLRRPDIRVYLKDDGLSLPD